jgi:phosphonatase-like hydrolase
MAFDHIELVMFDMAGTTVDDRLMGPSLVVTAFVEAFAKAGFTIAPEQVNGHRGKEKREAIHSLLRELGQSDDSAFEQQVAAIHSTFVGKLNSGVDSLREMQGAREVFHFLRGRGIRVGVGSGFPQEVVKAIVDKFGWETDGLVDYIGCAEQVGASRPDPKMILHAMATLDIADPKRVVKIGDTAVDILEGKNAGTWTVGVLSGSQSEEQLCGAGADYVLSTIAFLPQLFSL